jgi:hypothetical protein
MLELLIFLAEHFSKNPNRATATVQGWKGYTCANCGAQFEILMARTKTVRGTSKEAAQRRAVVVASGEIKYENDPRPCPTCGLYQPDMVARPRFRRHCVVFIAMTLFLIFVGTPLILVSPVVYWGYFMSPTTPWVILAVLLAGVLAHLRIDTHNPNQHAQSNRDSAQVHLDSGSVVVIKAGDELRAYEPQVHAAWRPAGHFILYAVMLTVPLFIPAGEIMRLLNGWSVNRATHPLIVAPGDSVDVLMPDTITCVEGYWRGSGRAEVLNAPDLGIPSELPMTSRSAKWNDQVQVKRREKSVDHRPFGTVEIPDDPRLAGQQLQLKMDLEVVYLQETADGFRDVNASFTQTTTMTLVADKGARWRYTIWYWVGGLGGLVLTWLMSCAIVLRTKGMRSKGVPTEVRIINE